MAASILSQRGKPKLQHDGHLYVFSKLNKDQSIETWRCQYKNSGTRKCSAYLHKSVASGETSTIGIHTDMPNAAAIEVSKKVTALKRRAADAVKTPQQIISNVRAESSRAAQGAMASNKGLARIVQRTRNRLGIPTTIYRNLAEINIPAQYRIFEDRPEHSENFLLGDSGTEDPNRIFIFGRANAASWIGHVSKIYVDGTFSLPPDLFSQIFVLLAERPGCVVPLCYLLMPNKNEDAYCKVSSEIRRR